jgi:hypothetical protein
MMTSTYLLRKLFRPSGAGSAFTVLLLTGVALNRADAAKNNWVQRVEWTDSEIVRAYRMSQFYRPRVPLTDEQIVGMYHASQSNAPRMRIHMGHGDPHFALRFNAELHGYNPKLPVRQTARTQFGRMGAQKLINRLYNAGSGVGPFNVSWELAGANTRAGALSGRGPIVNNPNAMAASEQTASRFPRMRGTTGGPYMARLDAAVANGEKVAIRFGRNGFRLIPRELPGRPPPPPTPLPPPVNPDLSLPPRQKLFVETGIRTNLPNTGWRSSLPPEGPNLAKLKLPTTYTRPTPNVKRPVIGKAGLLSAVILSCDNTGDAIQASGNFFRPYTEKYDKAIIKAMGPAPGIVHRVANNPVIDSVMDPIECGFNSLRFRVGWNGCLPTFSYTGSFQKGNGKGCWSFDYND